MSKIGVKVWAYTLMTGLLLSGVVLGAGTATPFLHSSSMAPGPAAAWGNLAPGWTMYHGGITVNGSARASPWTHFMVHWTTNLSGAGNININDNFQSPVQASPVVYGGSIYIPDSTTGNIYVVNATTGALSGYYDVVDALGGNGATGTVPSTPTIVSVGGFAYLVEATEHNTKDILALNLSSSAVTGCSDGDNLVASPALVPGQSVFIPAGNNRDIWIPPTAVNRLGTGGACTGKQSGPTGGGTYVSTASVGFTYPTNASEYFLSDFTNNRVDAFTANPFANLWQAPTTNAVYGSVALTNLSYNKTGGGQIKAPMGFVVDSGGPGAASNVYAMDVNALTGNPLGTFNLEVNATTDNGANSTVALQTLSPNSVRVVYATQGGNLSWVTASLAGSGVPSTVAGYSLNWSGSYNYSTGNGFAASPVVSGDLVMDGNTGGTFYILNTTTPTNPLVFTGQFPGSFLSSPALYNGNVYVLTSTGELADIGPATPSVQVSVPHAVNGGQSVPVHVAVTGVNVMGAANGSPVTNALVTLLYRGGSHVNYTYINTLPTNSNGVASFTWSAPVVDTPLSYGFLAMVNAPGYLGGEGRNFTTVNSTVGTLKTMQLTVSPMQTDLAPGQTTQVNFTLTASGGGAVAGASLSLLSPATGWTSTPGATNALGFSYANYTAPKPIPAPQSVLLGAGASATGYSNASGWSSLALTPAVAPGTVLLNVTVTPLSTAVLEGGTTSTITVVVSNSSSSAPVPGAQVTTTLSSAGYGSFNATSELTGSQGQANFTFTAGSTAGTVLGSFGATLSGAIGGSASMAISIQPPGTSTPLLRLDASAQTTASPGSPVVFTLHGYEVNSSTGALIGPAANAQVSAAIVTGQGKLSALTALLNGSGDNSSLSVTTGVASTAYLLEVSFTASLSGEFAGNVTSVAVVPPLLSASAVLSSATVKPGAPGSLVVTVTSGGQGVGGATISISPVSSSAVTLTNTSGVTGPSGQVTFPFTAGSQGGQTVAFSVTATKAGFAPAHNSTSLYITSPTVNPPPVNNTPTVLGLSGLDWVLVAIILLLLLALIAVFTRRSRPAPKKKAPKPSDEETSGETGKSSTDAGPKAPSTGEEAVGTAAVVSSTPASGGEEKSPAPAPEWQETPDARNEAAPESAPEGATAEAPGATDSGSMDQSTIMANATASEQKKGVYGNWSSGVDKSEGDAPNGETPPDEGDKESPGATDKNESPAETSGDSEESSPPPQKPNGKGRRKGR